MTITAAVLREQGAAFTLEELSMEGPRPDEVRVKIAATGMCHTDLVVRDGLMPAPFPIVLGHEGAGIVEAVGSAVTKVAPSDQVVLSYLSCGGCPSCARGWPTHCDALFPLNFGGSRLDGTSGLTDAQGGHVHASFFGQSSFATHALANQRNVVKVDASDDLAMLGPLGCGLLTGAGAVINVLKPEPGASLAVYGVGAVGLSGIMAARSLGVTTIVAVDRHQSRLGVARDLGATHVINTAKEDIVPAVKAATNGGADVALETTAVPAVVRAGVDALAMPGKLGYVGVAKPGDEVSIDMTSLLFGKQIIGIVEGDAVPDILIPHLAALYKEGRFPIDRLVKRYPLDAINEAAQDSESGVVIKPILVP